MIKAIIFDMDGLMFDSERLGIYITEKVMNDLPFDFDQDLNMRIIGTNMEYCKNEYVKTYGIDFPFDDMMRQKKEMTIHYYEENDIPKKAGLIELLQFLKENNYKIGVATSTYREKAEYMLKKANIYPFFNVIVCGDEVEQSKPNPDIYLKALQKLNVQKNEAFVIEDSENGLIAGQNAGISTIFIKDLITPNGKVLEKVTHKANTLHDVITILQASK
ncbi:MULTISPECIES: HAD family hydrolase [Bacillus]|uniref:HAD family hydrolase n=1 Tax=Bacillus TaxID=1386 RepID=UPI00031BA143|nr:MULTISPECIES: HAD family phosphatase [Bacillus]